MSRVLVLIDVQNDYFEGDILRIAFPPIEDSFAQILLAAKAAVEAKIPIVAVVQRAPKESPVFAAGSRGAALHDAVAALPLAKIVEKDLPSALASAALPDWLRENGIKTLTLAGYMTQNCVESTARQAAHDGYQVEILADATGAVAYRNAQGFASAQTIHQTSLIVMQSRFAAVLSTQDWIAGLKTGAAPLRETIFQSAIAGRAEV